MIHNKPKNLTNPKSLQFSHNQLRNHPKLNRCRSYSFSGEKLVKKSYCCYRHQIRGNERKVNGIRQKKIKVTPLKTLILTLLKKSRFSRTQKKAKTYTIRTSWDLNPDFPEPPHKPHNTNQFLFNNMYSYSDPYYGEPNCPNLTMLSC